ncbi:MAG: hypothetical protein RMJ66_07155, partial [Bacteroidia bacterium]|nr:hypothetical protein [Bacteroidia bacterium]
MRILRISLGILCGALFLHAQPIGESMSNPYDITYLFNNPTTTPDYYIWSWSAFDYTIGRTSDESALTGVNGPDLVWKIVLPECIDSLEVHFAYENTVGGNFPSVIGMVIYNPRNGEIIGLLENSYDSKMDMWAANTGAGWVSEANGYPSGNGRGPGSAYITGVEVSGTLTGGTGGGLGAPLHDSLRLAAGDTIYLIFVNSNDGAGGFDNIYVTVQAYKRLRPLPPPLDLRVIPDPSAMCMGQDLVIYAVAFDTLGDNRQPANYRFYAIDTFAVDGWYVDPSGFTLIFLGPPYFYRLNSDPIVLNDGYFLYGDRWVVMGIYKHPHYPSHPYDPLDPECEDTTDVSDTVRYVVPITLRPDPAIQIGNDPTLYQDGATVTLVEGTHDFVAHEELGINSNLLTYEWSTDNGVNWTSGQTLNLNLTAAGSPYELSLRVTNNPGVPGVRYCDSTIRIILDVTTFARGAQLQPTVRVKEGVLSLFIPGTGSYVAQVYDLQGRLLYQSNVEGGVTYAIPLSVRGVILLRVEGEGQV